MSLEDLGNIGEFVAAVGVIISLIYLAVQIRQNTASIRTSTQHQLGSVFANANVIMGSSPDAGWIFLRGLRDPDELTEEEVFRFATLFQAASRLYENVFYQRQAGALDDPAWFGWVQSMKATFSGPGARAWWKARRFMFHSEFCQFMEEEIQTDDATSLFSGFVSRPPGNDHNAQPRVNDDRP
jgi:hypothetical protein